jgi:cell division protein FtsW
MLKQLSIAAVGIIVLIGVSNINVKIYRRFAPYIFVASLIVTAMVFLPQIGFTHGGATRWLHLGPINFQPAEFLKIGSIILLAALLSRYKDKVTLPWQSIIPFFLIAGSAAAIVLKQPDMGTFLVIFCSLLAIYIAAGAHFKHIAIIILICVSLVSFLAYSRPYATARIVTFINPSADAQGSGYQIQQALIAVGSGGIVGRGFGQSIQKFNYLPEPTSDSIFAVAAEEFGFAGTVTIILIFTFFLLRGFKIAVKSKDTFNRLLATGIISLISAQVLINVGAIIGVMPLTGIPLSFISHGGSALMFTMIEAGILLNISKQNVRQKE